jgi:hypothetical protein
MCTAQQQLCFLDILIYMCVCLMHIGSSRQPRDFQLGLLESPVSYLSLSRGHDLVSRGHDILSRGHDLAILLSRGHDLVSRGHDILSRGHDLVSRGHDLVSRGHEIESI